MAAFFYFLTVLICSFFVLRNLKNIQVLFPAIFIASIMGFIHGFIPITHELSGYYDQFSQNIRYLASIYTFLSCGAFLIGTMCLSNQARINRAKLMLMESLDHLYSPNGRRIIKIMIAFSLIISTGAFFLRLNLLGVSLGEYISAGRFEFRSAEGGMTKWIIILGYFFQLLPCAFFFIAFILRKQKILGFLIAACVGGLLAYISGGGRIGALSILLCLILSFTIQLKRVKVTMLAWLACVGLFLLFSSIYIYEARKIVRSESISDVVELAFDPSTYTDAFESDPLNYNVFMLHIIERVPDSIEYQPFATVRRICFFPLSQQQFPFLKPLDPNHILGSSLSEEGVTIPPGLVGHAYFEYFGYFGIFAMFLYGIFVSWTSCFALSSPLRILSFMPAGGISLLIVSRGAYYEAAIIFIVISILFICLLKCISILGLKFYPQNRRALWK